MIIGFVFSDYVLDKNLFLLVVVFKHITTVTGLSSEFTAMSD